VGEETRSKVLQKDFFGGGVIATISRVQNGTLNGKRACLVALNISFRWSSDEYRFKLAEVQVSFERYPKVSKDDTGNSAEPVVRNLSPRKIYGLPNMNGQKWFYNVEQQCAVPQFGSTAPAGDRRAFEEEHRVEIVGKLWSDARKRLYHKGCWTIKEIGKQSFGIPDELNLAILVENESKFQAKVEVTVDVPLRRRLSGFPWPADDPVLFVSAAPDALIGEALRTSKFETLSDADWNLLTSGYEVRTTSFASLRNTNLYSPGIQNVDSTATYAAVSKAKTVNISESQKTYRVAGNTSTVWSSHCHELLRAYPRA
jgi:hypothetical protein